MFWLALRIINFYCMPWSTIGFDNQKKTFLNIIKNEAFSHAYIFKGSEQIGKKLFAQDLFKLINSRSAFDPADPDLYMVGPKVAEGETKIYIEDIRELKGFLSLRPFYGPYQYVIIDDAHRLTPEASNAFLKLLEEPTGKVIFVLVTSQPQELLGTISSRAQHISFLPHRSDVVASVFTNTNLSKPDQEFLSTISQGRIGWAINAAKSGGIKEIRQAVSDFGTILKSPLAERMLYAKKMFEKHPYQEEVSHWLSWAYANKNSIPNAYQVMTSLLTLHQYLNQPQYNHRALLENTLINL